MSASTRTPTRLNRRSLLKLAGIGTVAAGGAAVLLRAREGKPAGAWQNREDNTAGYRETDHVRLYYSLARL